MATLLQKKTANKTKKVIEGKINMTGGQILEYIGYSKAIAKNPKMVFQSKGFLEALKNLGFSLEAADLTVAKILQFGREENKLKASDQIYKRLSGYTPEKHQVAVWELSKEEKQAINKALEDE